MSQYYAKWQDGHTVIWRNLTWKEYNKFRSKYEQSRFQEPLDVAMEIYSTVLIDGPDVKFVPAGIPCYVCKHQMLNNPFSGRYEDIAPAIDLSRRMVKENYLLSAKSLIASTLNYKIEEIDNWDPNTFFLRLAQTEIAHGRTFDPVNPKTLKDSKGNPVPSIKPSLSPTQKKAVERTKDKARR